MGHTKRAARQQEGHALMQWEYDTPAPNQSPHLLALAQTKARHYIDLLIEWEYGRS